MKMITQILGLGLYFVSGLHAMESAVCMSEGEDSVNRATQVVTGLSGSNPVLGGSIVYTNDGKKTFFKVKDLIDENLCIDLSDPVFGDSSEHVIITLDPEQFFRFVDNSEKVVILIAPKFLIDEKIESSAKLIDPKDMADWNDKENPIGIFYRKEGWNTDEILPITKSVTNGSLTFITRVRDIHYYFRPTNSVTLSNDNLNLFQIWDYSIPPCNGYSFPRYGLHVREHCTKFHFILNEK